MFGVCSDKRPKKSEVEIEKDKLNTLKPKLEKSSDSHEKENLQSKIRETENHIRELENKDKPNNSNKSEQPKTEYGKLFLVGAVILSATILISEFATTASSKFLNYFQPSQDAFVIELLEKKQRILSGKTILDEFACGGTGLHASTGPIFNPHNSACIVGGSSSGSAWVVTENLVPWALGHDTGDSIRRPASYCGIVGFKPSYGLISRSGVIPMASSLDTVGILAQKTQDIKSVFAIISQKDPHDLLTTATKNKILSHQKNKVAVVAGIEKYLPSELSDLYHVSIKKLEKLGYTIEKITIPKKIREHLQITYLILCSSELVSHLNSLQGITYGIKENINVNHKRSKHLGEIVKQRLLIGAYFLENQDTNNTAPPAANFNHSFSGLPIGFINDLPVSININSNYGKDKRVLKIAEELEKEINFSPNE
ncbi:11104_t:CDS:2 [Diversispora eburnea]|uniref:11104_t:CDS:1 n=1 Tax=Diversispora eburnea TaxID=1213867 RepID=A0A9N9FGQ3_9GLOM|nr:11104_t:CDS:2 [Diversispora eburnea]